MGVVAENSQTCGDCNVDVPSSFRRVPASRGLMLIPPSLEVGADRLLM